MSLRQITIGSLAMSSVSLLRMMLQIFTLPVLARYLSPSDYGIVAMAMPFVIFAMMFSDAGISSSLIRTSHKNQEEWSTSFWLTVILGFILVAILSLFGYASSIFMNEPILAPVIAALSLTVFFQSLSAVPGADLQQSHKFATVAGIEIAAMAISIIGAVFLAIHGAGVWALVAQQIAQFLPRLVLTAAFSSFRPDLSFNLRLIQDHLVFGRNMLGISFINFLRQSIMNLAMGKILGTAPVGLYSMASSFADLPGRIVSGPIQNVLYPRIAALKDELIVMRTLFLFASKVISILIVPVIGMIAVAHDAVFTIVLSDKWAHAGLVFMALAPGAALQTVTGLRSTVAMAFGRTDILIRQATEMAIFAIFAIACTVYFGVEWVALGASIVAILYVPRSLKHIISLIDLDIETYVNAIWIPLLTTCGAIILYLIVTLSFDFSNWDKFAIAVCMGIVTVAVSIILQFKDIQKEIKFLRSNLIK